MAQEFAVTVKHLTIDDGLSSRYVLHLFQDSKGYIWISTAKGINRWDGYSMEVYSERMSVQSVTEDNQGTIWISYQTGHSDFQIQSPKAPIHLSPIQGGTLYADKWYLLGKIKEGILLWSIEEQIPYLYTNELTPCPGLTPFLKDKDYKIETTDSDRFWVIYKNEIVLLDAAGFVHDQDELEHPIFAAEMNKSEELIFHDYQINYYSLLFDQIDSIKIYKKTPREPIRHHYNLAIRADEEIKMDNPSLQFFQRKDKNELYWTKMSHTLCASDHEGNILYDNNQLAASIGGHLLSYVLFDKNENVWLATYNGVYNINISTFPFRNYLKDGTPGYSTRGIYRYNDTLLIHSYRGSQLIDLKNNSDPIPLAGVRPGNYFNTSFPLNDSIIYFGKHGKQIQAYNRYAHTNTNINHRFDKQTKSHEHLPYQVKKTQEVWVGGTRNLCILNEELQQLEHLILSGSFNQRPTNIRQFFENEKGLWIVARNGLFLIDAKEKHILMHFNSTNETLPFDELNYVYEDSNGIFWIATQGHGIIEWNPETGVHQTYGRGFGFLNLMVHAIYEDSYKRLWMPTDYGLVMFDKETKSTRIFLKQDGICSNEFNGFSHFKDEQGRLYFGGINGVNSFHPDSITNIDHCVDPLLHITSLTLPHKEKNGQTTELVEQIQRENKLVLQPNNTSFTIHFSFLDYYSQPNINYAFKLEGIDDDWTYQRENSIRFAGLPPGNYTLHIKAKGNSGVWTKNTVDLPITVLKPFYLKTLFLFGMAILAALLVFSYVRYRTYRLREDAKELERQVLQRTKKIEEQKNRLEKLNHTKARLYGIIAHDIRGPAYAFRGMASKINYLLKKNDMDHVFKLAAYVEESAEKLNRLLDDLLQWAQQQEGEIPFHAEPHNAKDLIQEVFSLLHIVAKIKNIQLLYEEDTDTEIIGDYQMLTTILRNLVENAIKFSFPDDVVKVSVRNGKTTTTNHQVIVVIEDGGIGMTDKQTSQLFNLQNRITNDGTLGEKGTGLGLMLIKELLDMHRAEIIVKSKLGEGTKIELTFNNVLK